jgi:hypothetical protein
MQRKKLSQRQRPQAPNLRLQILNKSQIPKSMDDGAKRRDLEDRTFQFADALRHFSKQLPRTLANAEDVRQLVRASGSVAANWIEADQHLVRKIF